MKKAFITFVLLSFCVYGFSQIPEKMSYQCVVRNSNGDLVTNQSIGMRITILQGSASGTVIYQESFNPNPQTNANGLVTLEVGGGVPIIGTFSSINWASGLYFLRTETDPTGGTNYTISGTNQLLSVPYAMHAKTADNGFSGNYNDLSNKPILFSGNYNDLSDRPVLFNGSWDSVTEKPSTLSGYGISDAVTITSNQTISGVKTFTNDLLISGLTIGRGQGAVSSNTAIGYQTLFANTTGINNTAVGYQSLMANTTGNSNLASGSYSLYSNINGHCNIALGSSALYKNQFGSNLVAVGDSALYSNIGRTFSYHGLGYEYGISNTALGSKTLFSNTDGNHNTASGYQALYSNTTGSDNTANGYQALYSNTTGVVNIANGYQALYSNTEGQANIASGHLALYSNTIGNFNTAYGYVALHQNTIGEYNTALGYGALQLNTTGSYNIAIGDSPLALNTTGEMNIAIGYRALLENTNAHGNIAIGSEGLESNTIGRHNTATGSVAMQSNTTGNYNTAYGFWSLRQNTTGSFNTAVGDSAGCNNSTGNFNTLIGNNSNLQASNLINATAIGSRALVNATNKVRIGDSNVTVIEGQVNWSVGSDLRLKEEIVYSNKLGLEFINALKTTTFTYKNDSMKKHHDGLIAQDVKQVLDQLDLEFSGLVESENEEKIMNLSYAEFVVPLINSVQELSKINQEQQNQIDELNILIKTLMANQNGSQDK